MSKFFRPIRWGFLIVVILILILIGTYIWFSVDGFIPSGNVQPADWLAFWGGFLAFFSSFILGAIAIWQNQQASLVNKRLLNLELKSKMGYLKLGYKPDYLNPNLEDNEDKYIVLQGKSIFVRNVGDDIIKIERLLFWSNIAEDFDSKSIEREIQKTIFSGDTAVLRVPTQRNSEAFEQNVRLIILVFMENSRGYKYKQLLYINQLHSTTQMNGQIKLLDSNEPHDDFIKFNDVLYEEFPNYQFDKIVESLEFYTSGQDDDPSGRISKEIGAIFEKMINYLKKEGITSSTQTHNEETKLIVRGAKIIYHDPIN